MSPDSGEPIGVPFFCSYTLSFRVKKGLKTQLEEAEDFRSLELLLSPLIFFKRKAVNSGDNQCG
ncbi:unnamed protein product [Dibothriocephalus latus]|uniref:Uncharacterized protein n=1 Tax=Dibothriocephalus latus TaxID=60516 RepID=A0A3P6QFY2_DIBLA|nr:unnamed protein product [Dibothriocephalus latus]